MNLKFIVLLTLLKIHFYFTSLFVLSPFLKEKLKIKILYTFITTYPIYMASYKTYSAPPMAFFGFPISSATVTEADQLSGGLLFPLWALSHAEFGWCL